MIQYFLWGIIILSLLGKICIIKNKLLWGFYLWAFTDLFLTIYNFSIGEIQQSILFFVFLLFSIWGIHTNKTKGGT